MELRRASEARLDELRRQGAAGVVPDAGVAAAGGPTPARLGTGAAQRAAGTPPGGSAPAVGYYGRPVLKAPPWTWEVPAYLFAGGVAGCAAVLGLGARMGGHPTLVLHALALALAGVLLSAALLVSDLGRPARFLHMLRVFKWRSPMSVGVWLLTFFGGAAAAAFALEAWRTGRAEVGPLVGAGAATASVAAAALGALVATYTGVLLAATVIPVWNRHATLLPVHFGAAALGSAAALLELAGHRLEALHWIALGAAAVETGVWIWSEIGAHPVLDAPLREGASGRQIRAAAVLAGPAALLLRLGGLRAPAAAVFLLGALLSRFAWLAAGRASADDPRAVL